MSPRISWTRSRRPSNSGHWSPRRSTRCEPPRPRSFAALAAGDVLAQLVPMAKELRMENGYAAVYLAATPQAVAGPAGLRGLYLASPDASGGVSRDFFTERWQGELFEMVYNDQQGIFLWRHYPAQGGAESII